MPEIWCERCDGDGILSLSAAEHEYTCRGCFGWKLSAQGFSLFHYLGSSMAGEV